MVENFELAREKDAAKQFACSQPYLKKKRQDGTLLEGIHWIRLGKRAVRYVIPVMIDFFRNRHQPYVHQQFIEDYVASWNSNQPRKPGRKPRNLVVSSK
jgi:hypothetical protein